jgi:hypothetical protein
VKLLCAFAPLRGIFFSPSRAEEDCPSQRRKGAEVRTEILLLIITNRILLGVLASLAIQSHLLRESTAKPFDIRRRHF